MGFPSGSVVKNLPAMQETQVQSLGMEDPLEKVMTIHPRILAWRIPWAEEPGRVGVVGVGGGGRAWALQSMGLQRTEHD